MSVLLALPSGTNSDCTTFFFWEEDCQNDYNSTSRVFSRTWWGLTEVPQDIPADARVVNLRGNKLTSSSFEQEGSDALSNVEELNLRKNHIRSIEGVWRGLGSLKQLDLRENQLWRIRPGALSALLSLENLLLYWNNIGRIENGSFAGLQSLKVLDLTSNKISVVEVGAFECLKNLEKLYLRFNDIRNIAGVFSGLHSLKILSLSGNEISKIEEGTFDSTGNLEQLHLSSNKLSFARLNGADVWRGLSSLKYLGLSSNKMFYIEKGAFASLNTLEQLDLNLNKLRSVDGLFDGLYRLKYLFLYYNEIDHIEDGIFDSLYSLTTVTLGSNKLTTVRWDLFKNAKRPIELDLNPMENKWDCSSLCWLKQEEQHGTVTWSYRGAPSCESLDWASFACGNPGKSDFVKFSNFESYGKLL